MHAQRENFGALYYQKHSFKIIYSARSANLFSTLWIIYVFFSRFFFFHQPSLNFRVFRTDFLLFFFSRFTLLLFFSRFSDVWQRVSRTGKKQKRAPVDFPYVLKILIFFEKFRFFFFDNRVTVSPHIAHFFLKDL